MTPRIIHPRHHHRRWLLLLPLVLVLLATVACVVLGADEHIDDVEDFEGLDEATKEEMRKREVENCVPFNIRSFVLGQQAVIEWSTRRTYIRKVHKPKHVRGASSDAPSPWQSCRDDGYVEARFRKLGDTGEFKHEKTITYVEPIADSTSHKAWIDLDNATAAYEYVVGSMFHGWSNIHLLGENRVLHGDQVIRCRPKHVHTAYGREPGSFAVQWMTDGECRYGESQLKLVEGYHAHIDELTPVYATAKTTLFVDDGKKRIERWMHVVRLSGLKTSTRYTYVVGNSEYAWSIPYSTKTSPSLQDAHTALPMRFLVTGDIGYQNAATLPMMQSEVADGAVDAVVSMGDYAYDLHLADGHVGDIFMEEIEPIAASVPFMVAPGNHEMHNVFSHYTERFRLMPSNTGIVHSGHGEAPNNWFYSLDVGLVHFVFFSTEIYFKKTLDSGLIEKQEAWLRQDLAAANAQREKTPWLIVLGHRPMYCTSDEPNCGKKATFLRSKLEDMFYENGVDLYICGHQHNYERGYDIYRSETWKRTKNMKATTHILTGASGQYILSVMRKQFERPAAEWDAFRNSIFGYSRMHVHNATHIRWQQVESDPENPAAKGLYGQVVDDVWLVQEHHGSFSKAGDQALK